MSGFGKRKRQGAYRPVMPRLGEYRDGGRVVMVDSANSCYEVSRLGQNIMFWLDGTFEVIC